MAQVQLTSFASPLQKSSERMVALGTRNRIGVGLGIACVLAATYWLYAATFRFQFVYDDIFQIVQNDHLRSWRFLPVYFTQHFWSHVPGVPANFYRPVFLLWLRMNYLLFGTEPAGWHLATVLLHLQATGLVCLLARKLLKNWVAALAAGLVFALHPVQAESVAWISGATEPLGAVFFLTSFLCYLHGSGIAGDSPRGRTKTTGWAVFSVALFALALLTKETAAVLPLVIAAYELTVGAGDSGEPVRAMLRRHRWFLPYWMVLACYWAARTAALHGFAHRMNSMSWVNSAPTWPWLVGSYIRTLVWPGGLSPLYDPIRISNVALGVIPPLIALALGAAAIWWVARQNRRFSDQIRVPVFLAAWFLLTLAPALLAFAIALPDEAFHDRYLYLPSVAFALAVGMGFCEAWKKAPLARGCVAAASMAALLIALAVAAHSQIGYWASNYDLFQRAAAEAPHNQTAQLNFAAELLRSGEFQRALTLSQAIIAQHRHSSRAFAIAGSATLYLHRYVESESYYATGANLDPSQAALLYRLGLVRMRMGHDLEAEIALQRAAELAPELAGVHYALGSCELHLGKFEMARKQFSAELMFDPSNHDALFALTMVQNRLRSESQQRKVNEISTRPD